MVFLSMIDGFVLSITMLDSIGSQSGADHLFQLLVPASAEKGEQYGLIGCDIPIVAEEMGATHLYAEPQVAQLRVGGVCPDGVLEQASAFTEPTDLAEGIDDIFRHYHGCRSVVPGPYRIGGRCGRVGCRQQVAAGGLI